MIEQQTNLSRATPTPIPGRAAGFPGRRPVLSIPDHQLIRPIGVGGYGEVWLARNVMGTYRAVKTVYRDSFSDDRPYEREFNGIKKFEPISRSNDGLVDILQIGRNDDEGWFYYVMELGDSAHGAFNLETYSPKTLRTEIERHRRLPADQCLQYALSLSLALGHLHRHGLLHRDIKPSNIVFVGGIPKLADIGLVTDQDEARSFVGTEGFIPPEGPNSPQADIYSLGKVLYEISMGKDRLDFPEPFTLLGQDESAADLEELNAVILKACALAPEDRYQTAEEMHVDLALLRSGKSVKARQTLERRLATARKAALLVGGVAVVAAAAYVIQRQQTAEVRRHFQRAEELLATMQIQKAEDLLRRDESALGLAHLADVLRRHPKNRVAAERILAALTQRHFPKLALKPLVHPANLWITRFNQEGTVLATATTDGFVHFWNPRSGEQLSGTMQHSGQVNSIAFSRDGKRLLSASNDRTAQFWDVEKGTPFISPLVHPAAVTSAVFSPDEKWIATSCADGKTRLFDSTSGELVRPAFMVQSDAEAKDDIFINSVVFSPGGSLLACASENGAVQIWSVRSGELKHLLPFPGRSRVVQFSPDGSLVAATVQDPSGLWQVRVWRASSGEPHGQPLQHKNRIYTLEFSPNGKQLLTSTVNNAARVWNVETGELSFSLPHKNIVRSARYSTDGKKIITASLDHSARVWDTETGAPLSEPMLHDNRVVAAMFNATGDLAVTAGEDKTAKLWKSGTDSGSVETLREHRRVGGAEFDRTGAKILTTTRGMLFTANGWNSWDFGGVHAIRLHDRSFSVPPISPQLPVNCEPLAAKFTSAGARALILTNAFSPAGWIWDLEKQTRIGGMIEHPEEILTADFNADGTRVATGSRDGTARIWDAASGRPLTPPLGRSGRVYSVCFSPDGKLLASSSDEGAEIWDADSGGLLHSLPRERGNIWRVRFNNRGDRLVTIASGTARVWTTNGVLISSMRHGDGAIEYAEFSPDGTKLVTASGDRTARLWDASTGRQLTEALEHGELVLSARFSADGSRVITASVDGTAQIWNAATGLRLADPFRHGDVVTSAAFSPDGTEAVTTSFDGTTKLWRLPLLNGTIPPWLPDLTEAISGQRLNADRVAEPVPWGRLSELQEQLRALEPADSATTHLMNMLYDLGGSPAPQSRDKPLTLRTKTQP